jgi:hypothetical protein
MITYDVGLKIFSSSLINSQGYFSGFATRQAGDGRKTNTVLNFLKGSDIKYQKIVVPEQIHSANISLFMNQDRETFKKIEETDGVITRDKEVVLTCITADCCPIIFKDEAAGIIGICHVGWRGSFKRMPQIMVSKMEEIGAELKNIKVAIGPSIGECCYDIADDRYWQFLEEYEPYADQIFQHRGGKWYMNLPLLNYLLLREAGIEKETIDHFPFCTKCDKERFFSYRRDKKEDYGEMFSFVVKSV